jgi:hypothetical protein
MHIVVQGKSASRGGLSPYNYALDAPLRRIRPGINALFNDALIVVARSRPCSVSLNFAANDMAFDLSMPISRR